MGAPDPRDPSVWLDGRGIRSLVGRMRSLLLVCGSLLLLGSCSSLPVPGAAGRAGSGGEAARVLGESGARHGSAWQKYRRVEVGYDGRWSTIAVKVQPVITDAGYRKSSREVYQPRARRVEQVHRGVGGTKLVTREQGVVEVSFNGVGSSDPEVVGAAGLVADAYTIFLFGSSWLAEHGRDLGLLADEVFDGETCRLVAGRLAPGLGEAREDFFIAWIGAQTGLLKRFQFSLNGMDSTRGADVDVVFSEHWQAPDGSVWPGRFVESIQRPIHAKAHDWWMTSLALDGRKVR